MVNNPNKRINYCLIDKNGIARVIVVIKWEKGNLYFMDINQPWKKSYHTPRKGKSQVHLKVNGFMPMDPDFDIPIEDIKGYRMMGGSAMKLDDLPKLPEAKENNGENYILDPRPFHISHLSQVQWTHYLVEPGEDQKLIDHLSNTKDESKMSEQLVIHKLTDSTPWIVTEFSRVCDENPLWYT